ncbi:hypothetical protein TL18_04730 [Methanobrevibacter sp. YE315]|uniref:hypothetical protein n=1 Tax=Methanobrevibacter sp. YE315 TaxID=1609968 RepID=UPI000764E822|nr:hypothetical protein [Methanobrevibacter sp. YE315]AMD17383.1 hypothetical protein TL18_04730 [Methanobrevibacter sp. YE315]
MKTQNIILIAIAVLVIALVAVGIYSFTDGNAPNLNVSNNNTTKFINIGTINGNNTTNTTNVTVVGDNSTRNVSQENGTTVYKVYVPQTDSYVPVIGEKYDNEVHRWYTYDKDGVRYYNTRINH